ncbi:MAG: tyrosine--tRNA ligase [Candidatus Coatesbacteria bacterium]|nr:tyrosine--tRNA ligase [Candidatus Coatesbacteria bacterium]
MDLDSALERLLDFRTAEVFTREELREKLAHSERDNKPLRIKLGVDPTAPDIHLGHAVVLRKMRQFQDLGHIGVLIIGDYTAMVGDPSGRSKTRPQLSYEEIERNAATYREQVFKILDPKRTEIVLNGDWFKKLSFKEVMELTSRFTVARLLERDDFEKRLSTGQPLGLHEILYPVMQAYDSVMVQADVELGATEQTFNILMGRQLQEQMGQERQIAFLVPVLTGTCGSVRMSKSIGNYIGIAESPQEMFGKTMSIKDSLIVEYLRLATDYEIGEIERLEKALSEGEVNPRDVKFQLAERIAALYHGQTASQGAASDFERVFKRGESPSEMPVLEVKEEDLRDGKVWIAKLLRLAKAADSNSNALGLVSQGAVFIDGVRVDAEAPDVKVASGMTLRVGRHRFFRVELSKYRRDD